MDTSAVDNSVSKQEPSLKKEVNKKSKKKSKEISAEEAKRLLLSAEELQNSLRTEASHDTLQYLTSLSLYVLLILAALLVFHHEFYHLLLY